MDSITIIVLKSVLVSRAKFGATIREIKDDYAESEGKTIKLSDDAFAKKLLEIPGITSKCVEGQARYFCNSSNTAHIVKMVERQRTKETSNPFLNRNINKYKQYNPFYKRTATSARPSINFSIRNTSRITETRTSRWSQSRPDTTRNTRNNSNTFAMKSENHGQSSSTVVKTTEVANNVSPECWDTPDEVKTAITNNFKAEIIHKIESNPPISNNYEVKPAIHNNLNTKIIPKSELKPATNYNYEPKPTINNNIKPIISQSYKNELNNNTIQIKPTTPTNTFNGKSLYNNMRDPRAKKSCTIPVPMVPSPTLEQTKIKSLPNGIQIPPATVNHFLDNIIKKEIEEYDPIIERKKREEQHPRHDLLKRRKIEAIGEESSPLDNFLLHHRQETVVKNAGKHNQVTISRGTEDQLDPRKKSLLPLVRINHLLYPMWLVKIPGYSCTDLAVIGEGTDCQQQTVVVPNIDESPENFGTWKYKSFLYHHELIGDNFFLQLLKRERGHILIPGKPEQTIGSCIARQRIKDAVKLVQNSNREFTSNVVIYLGTVDLLEDHTAAEMIEDFKDLIAALRLKGVRDPIISTLTPLANKSLYNDIIREFKRFNRYLLDRYVNVIDLYELMVDRKSNLITRYYKRRHRYEKSDTRMVLWSRSGRRRVLDYLTAKLQTYDDISSESDDHDQHSSYSVSSESDDGRGRSYRDRGHSSSGFHSKVRIASHATYNYNVCHVSHPHGGSSSRNLTEIEYNQDVNMGYRY